MAELEIHYNDGTGALYVDGVLDVDTVGDDYHAEDKAFDLLGVKRVPDSDFMRGSRVYSDAAPTLDAIGAWQGRRDSKLAEAKLLRQRADELEAEAKQR